MSTDKRKVATDALETLGTIIDETGKRDAIHLAVEPVVAGETLRPGDHIGIERGQATRLANKKLGIVDPFLNRQVAPGERFWLIVYPRQITSLRHVWSHPDFIEPEDAIKAEEVANRIIHGDSKKWITNFAENIGQSFESLMDAANVWVQEGEYTYDNDENYTSATQEEWEQFWTNYTILTGREPAERHSFFTCSC